MIETRLIKDQFDLRDLANRYTELRRASAKEQAGPCPKCGGTDRFHCTADWFFCRQCHEKRGDVIEFVQWLEGCDFRTAVDKLGGTAMLDLPKGRRQPAEKKRPTRDYRTLAVKAVWTLASEQGAPGRAYLESRGLQPETWKAWGLGLHRCKRRGDGQGWLALGWGIAMPWVSGDQVTGVNCRLLDHKQRYHRYGNVSGLFGEHKLAGREMLICCEGELNALSIWQALEGLVDVLSFGAESGVKSQRFIEIAECYSELLVWCDREAVVESVLYRLERAKGIKSPRDLDANAMLQDGILAEFLARFMPRANVEPEEVPIEESPEDIGDYAAHSHKIAEPAKAASERGEGEPDKAQERLDYLLSLGIAASPEEVEEAIGLGRLLGILVERKQIELTTRPLRQTSANKNADPN